LLTIRALFMILFGLALGVGAAWMFLDARSLPTIASQVTDDDLLRIKTPVALPDWICYIPSKSIDTGVEYIKLRSLNRTATSKFILIAIKDHWLLAQVAPNYNSRRIDGKLVAIDRVALAKIEPNFRDQMKRLLPYQLDGRTELSGYQRSNYFLGGFFAILGTLSLFSGARGLMARPASFRGTVRQSEKSSAPGSQQLASHRFFQGTAPAPAETVPVLQPASPLEAAPRRRSRFLRALVTVVWAALLFAAAIVITSVVCVVRAGNDPEAEPEASARSRADPGSVATARFRGTGRDSGIPRLAAGHAALTDRITSRSLKPKPIRGSAGPR
jgi:hypothetical protein